MPASVELHAMAVQDVEDAGVALVATDLPDLSMEWSELYMLTMVCSWSSFNPDFSVFCFRFLVTRRTRPSMRRRLLTSVDMVATTFRISLVEEGKRSPSESMLSWMLMTRASYWRHRSRKAPSSRMPRRALLNFATTMVSPFLILIASCDISGAASPMLPATRLCSHSRSPSSRQCPHLW